MFCRQIIVSELHVLIVGVSQEHQDQVVGCNICCELSQVQNVRKLFDRLNSLRQEVTLFLDALQQLP